MSETNEENIKTTDTATLEGEIRDVIQKLHHEINFASKALSLKNNEFGNNLNDSIAALKDVLAKLETATTQVKEQNTMMLNELTTFALLPEKVANNITNVIPQIAKEVEKIHTPSVFAVKEQFTSMCDQLTNDAASYKHQLEDLTNQTTSNLLSTEESLTAALTLTTNECIEQISSITEKFNASMEQKLTQFTNHLANTVDGVSSDNSSMMLRRLCVVIAFSAIVSGVTSYAVTTQFPRYVEIKGARDLTVHNSRVEVLGGKVSDQKEDVSKTLAK